MFDSQGVPWLWHADSAGRPVWTRLLAKRAFASGDWVRLSLDFDYVTNPDGLPFVQVRLDGWCVTATAGWKSPGDPTAHGSWFRLPASAAAARSISEVSFEGAAALDDLVLDARNAADPSPFGPERVFIPQTTILLH